MLSRWATVEDWYGSQASEAYSQLLTILVREGAQKEEIMEICRRGLQVSLRDERFDAARQFAVKLADLGDHSGRELVQPHRSIEDRVSILGGVAAFHSLLARKGKANPDRFFLDYCRVLSSIADNSNGQPLRALADSIHEYFRQLAALTALGSRKTGHIEIVLTLNDEAGRQRTEAALAILGLKLVRAGAQLTVELAEGKAQAKRQDTKAALAIDDRGIEDALSNGRPYSLEIPVDSVAVYPAAHVWQAAFGGSQRYRGGLAELFVDDPHLARLYVALNSMDRDAAEALLKAIPLPVLAEKYSRSLYLFATAFALNNGGAEVPGGRPAGLAWQQLAGENPANPAAFFQALLARDGGRLIAFFDALAHVDLAHQQFFTRSADRTKRFYELFRDSPEMRFVATQRVLSSALLDFFREVPLNGSGGVAFPGSPEVWMVAKGGSESAASARNLTQQLKSAPRPVSDDAVLIRMANTEYKDEVLQKSELANFIAVARINRHRSEPLSPDSALLLAQSYPRFGAFFPYFSVLTGLNAPDFQDAIALAAKMGTGNFATANVRLGEFHSFLAMLCLVEQSGIVSGEEIRQLYRLAMKRYLGANDAASSTMASLSAIDDLARLVSSDDVCRRDDAIRTLLIDGGVENPRASGREKAYRRVLARQKVPSLDALFVVRDALRQLPDDPGALDRIRQEISTFGAITPPYSWRLEPERQNCLERYQTRKLESALSKLQRSIAEGKRDRADIQKFSARVLGELEPWVELAMAGQIYARYLDPSDLVVSADPLLLRKHVFAGLELPPSKRTLSAGADFKASSLGEGSYFCGGFAEFGLAAGQARAEGNHLGSPWGQAVAGAIFASVQATDWRPLTESALQTFGANVRLAREWIVESAVSEPMREQLEEQSRGLLSFSRRQTLLAGIAGRDWAAVWQSATVGDLYFLGKSLVHQAPAHLWTTPALIAMKGVAAQPESLDLLGQVAPDLSGTAVPCLQHYQPYEEYGRYSLPQRMAERVAELKLYLAWSADSSASRPAALEATASLIADAAAKKIAMRDMWDWSAVLNGFRGLEPQILGALRNQ